MKIGEVLNGVYDKSVGWRPSSGAIKPVHIANGLFRDLIGQTYNIKRAVAFAIPWKKKNSPEMDPRRSYSYLVHETKDPRFQGFADDQYKERFERLREFIRGLLAADGAVFPQAEITSFSLTCRQMISSDRNDREVGRFMAEILRGQDKNGSLAKLVIEALSKNSETPQDPISFLAWPLLSQEPEHISRKSSRASPYDNRKLKQFFKQLEVAAQQLAEHEKSQGNRLATLQRAVHFSCLSLLSHVQALAVNGKLQNRPPLLLTMAATKGSRLALASEESLNNCYRSFESWLAEQLSLRLEKGQPIICGTDEGEEEECLPNLPAQRKDSVRKFLSEIADEKGNPVDHELLDDRMSLWEQSSAKCGKDNWALVMGETIVQCYLNEYTSGGPRQFLGGVGRKAGIIFPHFQGRSKEKRIRPSVAILDVLVKSCCPSNEPIPFNQFLDHLWLRFGIVVGGRIGDEDCDRELLLNHCIDISQAELEENSLSFIDHLVQIGLARRYPDNIAYVGKYNA